MKLEQQKQIKLDAIWIFLRPVLKALVEILGNNALQYLASRLDDVSDGGASTDGVGGTYPNCDPGYTPDHTNRKCVKDPGV